MAVFAVRNILKRQVASKMTIAKFSDVWTPDYLESMKPKIPLYPTINIQIKGFDYPVLEQYQRLVHKLTENMDLDIENSHGLPAKNLKIKKYKPGSSVVEAEYKYDIYERDIQISNISSPKLPILIRLLEAALPEGVSMAIEEWSLERDELRFVPDKELMDLKTELEGYQRKKS